MLYSIGSEDVGDDRNCTRYHIVKDGFERAADEALDDQGSESADSTRDEADTED